MENIYDIFADIKIETRRTERGLRYFDPLRNIFVPITPEELVRQKTIVYLRDKCHVPLSNMYSEEHLSHYSVEQNGRMDIVITENIDETEKALAVVECKNENIAIEAEQVIEQALNYAELIGARYFILVNGIHIRFYKKHTAGYIPVKKVLTYAEMTKGTIVEFEEKVSFERMDYADYCNIAKFKKLSWYNSKIGEDTPEKIIPFILNFDDCLYDENYKLKSIICSDFSIIDDLGIHFRQYNDASDGGFGTGDYRSFVVYDRRKKVYFLIGFSIISTGKTINDPKYGNTDGKSVLVIIINDGDTDEMSVQINLNKFIQISGESKVLLTHNGAVTRKGASKERLFSYIQKFTDEIVHEKKIVIGELDYSVPLTMSNNDVIAVLSHLIEYAVYRNEYKKSLSSK